MLTLKYTLRLCAAASLLLVSACAVNVAPWERGFLAKPQMAADFDPLGSAVRLHVQHSKEASSGGRSGGGGGCGCS